MADAPAAAMHPPAAQGQPGGPLSPGPLPPPTSPPPPRRVQTRASGGIAPRTPARIAPQPAQPRALGSSRPAKPTGGRGKMRPRSAAPASGGFVARPAVAALRHLLPAAAFPIAGGAAARDAGLLNGTVASPASPEAQKAMILAAVARSLAESAARAAAAAPATLLDQMAVSSAVLALGWGAGAWAAALQAVAAGALPSPALVGPGVEVVPPLPDHAQVTAVIAGLALVAPQCFRLDPGGPRKQSGLGLPAAVHLSGATLEPALREAVGKLAGMLEADEALRAAIQPHLHLNLDSRGYEAVKAQARACVGLFQEAMGLQKKYVVRWQIVARRAGAELLPHALFPGATSAMHQDGRWVPDQKHVYRVLVDVGPPRAMSFWRKAADGSLELALWTMAPLVAFDAHAAGRDNELIWHMRSEAGFTLAFDIVDAAAQAADGGGVPLERAAKRAARASKAAATARAD
ncbi:hypothetical protein Rsub_10388 [Raphidocelis subcapitata]|uniref:Uncharacterized protein n=1 Tax=Raphidocelis subcapitata TaxID=307507 RepID=A0A2V0PKA4_9CHLO|nr:hypothetical protein Rsub_10388 [Raphidocelis subcapitata]|eukprot:GBF97465.1 hypothetical protein Rsub_10388 [Raphidocelis subcapitata]